jgi:hypothetical protein
MELLWGQLNLCLLVLFLIAWQALRQGKDWMGGTLLGSLLLLKLAGWPIVLWLAFKRRWRAVWAAGLFCAGGHLLAIGLHGWGMVRDYYLKVGPQVSALYRVRDHNLSVWTIGQRLFAQSGYYLASTPLWESPLLVKTLTLLAPAVVLALALRAALRAKSFDTAVALLMAIGITLSPIAWPHYLLLAAPALALLLRRLSALRWPRRMTWSAIPLLIALSAPQDLYVDLAELFSTGVNAAGQPVVPGLLASLALIPTGALCLLLWLLARLESREERQTSGNSDAIDLAEAGEGLLAAR